ncbi:GMP synthase-Glutamine amidotransferase [Chitinophaga costaii]|uniref:GMP synthase-Glutamine amidotransferase n=1 Tax=Chitinophaga costaii TaxID=1335309 RepID=A0A1C4ERQ1_9BACT|nr:GMP synthase [Chitinophaga costaii]PUZ22548.1 GMP synthase [Chitinophaga costaii]SCC46270.1 GMP synthase-Glutamine amidotransferase [Chitinophaga costaii]
MSSVKRVAILDMYEGVANEGMRCIREVLQQYGTRQGIRLETQEFEVRTRHEMADLSFDLYISTGGPGSPLDSEGSEWEQKYFALVDALLTYNETAAIPKKMLAICHSFQLLCRRWNLGKVCLRRSPAFGVFPVHKTAAGQAAPIFQSLPDPFYIVDSRSWQVVEINAAQLTAHGAQVLALEKDRPHVQLERATMAIRFNEHFLGTQFHPEADAAGMRKHLLQPEKRWQVVKEHGAEKYESMIEQLNDPDKIMFTHDHFIPAFLDEVFAQESIS